MYCLHFMLESKSGPSCKSQYITLSCKFSFWARLNLLVSCHDGRNKTNVNLSLKDLTPPNMSHSS